MPLNEKHIIFYQTEAINCILNFLKFEQFINLLFINIKTFCNS
jgi:hypothetical protein